METRRRQYSEEFKKEAVEYSLSPGKTVEEVARDLGISPHNLSCWRSECRKLGELAFPGHGQGESHSSGRGKQKTKKELADIQIERDLLKVALAIFTKEP